MSRLYISVLGAPQVRYGAQNLTFPTRKTLALLIYLIVEGRMQPREKMMALLWLESDGSHARGALRMTLYYLRRTLDSAVPHGGDTYLHIATDTLGFNFDAAYEFDLLAVANALGTQPASVLQAAVDLYRGPFLEGFSLSDAVAYDDWVSLQREQVHQQLTLLFDRLTQMQSTARQFTAGIANAVRWVAHDPFNELAHRRLMQLHTLGGNKSAALQAYTACQYSLEAELGVAPSRETEALADRIRTDRMIRSESHKKADLTTADHIVTPVPVHLVTPFVGRSNEHAQLAAFYLQARQGQTLVVVIKGEAGIGKTRLAAEFLTWVAVEGAHILRGQAFEAGGRLSYQPMVEALRVHIREESAPGGQISDVWLAELSRLLPELRDCYPHLPMPLSVDAGDEAVARTRLLEAIARLGHALAEHQPLVLFIDDMHWADAASLETLYYCGRTWAASRSPVLLLLTVRAEALAADPDLSDWLDHVERGVPVVHLPLGPISVEETVQLVEIWQKSKMAEEQNDKSVCSLPTPLDISVFAAWLYRETAGHPFFISEMLKTLQELGVTSLAKQAADGRVLTDWPPQGLTPSRVRQLILGKLNQLSLAARALLTAAAVIGRPFSFEHLCQIANISEDEALPGLDELLHRHLLVEATESARPYTFSHDKIRDVVYTEAGDARRRFYHRRIFTVLEAAAAPPAELAHHALAAYLAEPAFRYSIAAGDEALHLFAVRDAIAHYEQAQRVSTRNEPSLVQHLYFQLGRAYELDNQFEKAQSVYEELLAFAQVSGHLEIVCKALNHLATVAILNGVNLDQAAGYLHQAQRIAEEGGHKAALAEIEWNLAQVNFYRLEGQKSRAHAERALALARELGSQELIARSLNAMAYAVFLLGQWPAVECYAGEGQTLFAALGNRPLEVDCLNLVIAARINTGLGAAGVQAGRTALAMSQAIENVWGQGNSMMQLVPGLLDVGEYGEALKSARESVALARKHVRHMLPLCLARLGATYRTLLDLDTAQAILLEAMAANEEIAPPPVTATIAAELCAVRAPAGSWNEAYASAKQVLLAKKRSLLYTGLTCWYEIEALLRAGDEEKAREHLHDLRQLAQANPRLQLAYLRVLAVQAQWQSHVEQAIAYLQEATILAEALGLPGEQWPLRATLGKLYDRIGETERAHGLWIQACQIVHNLAETISEKEIRAAFLAAAPVQEILGKKRDLPPHPSTRK